MSVTNRQEILFIYEAKDCNPNGDPLDENKPRTDPETGVATVTDVRIKRTVRDYLHQVKGQEILVRDTFDNNGYLRDGKGRCEDFYQAANVNDRDSITDLVTKVQKAILQKCIDTRLFGCTLPVEFGKKKSSIRLAGPVQFNGFNRSLHRIAPVLVQGTAGFASKKDATQKSFREEYIVPYACIAACGVVNEVAARSTTGTGLSDADVSLLLEGLWKGTQGLISRSKEGHNPLALIRLTYRDSYRIGDLAGRISLVSDKEDIQIRSINDYHINVAPLLDAVQSAKEKIVSIEVLQDDRLVFLDGAESGKFADLARLDKLVSELKLG
ncbi:MAG: type I-B CRISPR-associated protein Cas7/Csh2 [Proteobacteria bacterium]|nr:type I-B CRISPR-associated protein Cas7/Csh2 [Pseudomonadota bacterium]MBU1714412.1 type I-B CRISPR-associated protein Cas7/Csh2 [Pseudomonadota bacterium]